MYSTSTCTRTRSVDRVFGNLCDASSKPKNHRFSTRTVVVYVYGSTEVRTIRVGPYTNNIVLVLYVYIKYDSVFIMYFRSTFVRRCSTILSRTFESTMYVYFRIISGSIISYFRTSTIKLSTYSTTTRTTTSTCSCSNIKTT